jgi:GrpB-like predicted nucleotidyltransferase (UPF0157 family)
MITIHPYNPDWPGQFEVLRKEILAALGRLALRVDHIGSTSVPGLGAKDVIDIQVTVAELTEQVRDRMASAGFRMSEYTQDHVPVGEDPNPVLWTKMYFHERSGQRLAHIHIRKLGNPNQRYPLLFRDYLRSHSHSAGSIEIIKRQLARYHPEDAEAYYDIKDPVYDLIWEAAKDWAAATDWQPV